MPENTNYVAERVIQRVSEATNRTELEVPPLYDAVDPDALEQLVESTSNARFTFQYAGCEVTVESDGEVQVSETAPAQDGPPPGQNETPKNRE